MCNFKIKFIFKLCEYKIFWVFLVVIIFKFKFIKFLIVGIIVFLWRLFIDINIVFFKGNFCFADSCVLVKVLLKLILIFIVLFVECILGFNIVFVLGNLVNGKIVFFIVIWLGICFFRKFNFFKFFLDIINDVIFVKGFFIVLEIKGIVFDVWGFVFKIYIIFFCIVNWIFINLIIFNVFVKVIVYLWIVFIVVGFKVW